MYQIYRKIICYNSIYCKGCVDLGFVFYLFGFNVPTKERKKNTLSIGQWFSVTEFGWRETFQTVIQLTDKKSGKILLSSHFEQFDTIFWGMKAINELT